MALYMARKFGSFGSKCGSKIWRWEKGYTQVPIILRRIYFLALHNYIRFHKGYHQVTCRLRSGWTGSFWTVGVRCYTGSLLGYAQVTFRLHERVTRTVNKIRKHRLLPGWNPVGRKTNS